MIQEQKSLPNWILIVSGLLALMELGVSLSLFFSPQSMADNIDLNAKGVDFLIYMWATRQFALGFIFAYATIKKSIPMLTLAYIFLLVMFVGDLIVGVLQKNNTLIIGGIVMTLIALALIFLIQKKK
ncbi:MAG: hypothetical protein IPO78_06625 [Saprospiraceae bacterium]|nr:hypothetical protein [Saprospiraceae bacterium]MBK9721279.1 hypothetical protein [Saprospiraceae bacterium]